MAIVINYGFPIIYIYCVCVSSASIAVVQAVFTFKIAHNDYVCTFSPNKNEQTIKIINILVPFIQNFLQMIENHLYISHIN